MRARTLVEGPGRLVGHRLADALVLVIGSWTVAAHLAMVAGWSRALISAVFVGVLMAALVAVSLLTDHPDEPDGATEPTAASAGATSWPWLVLGAVGVLVAATAWWRPEGAAFAPVWAGIVVLGAAAAWLTDSGRRPNRPPMRDLPAGSIYLLAAVAALGTLVLVRQDLDDVELINRSLYVEARSGPLPTRDTVIADEVFASDRPGAPETTIEALIGTVAAAVPVSATTVAHLWWAPLVAGVGVLALHRLLMTLGAPLSVAASWAGWAWLLLDGEVLRSLGNHGIGRAWQGKAVLLVLVVPTLWHHLLRWAARGSPRSLMLAAACAVAGVGLSRTATFVVPLVVVLVAAATLVVGPRRRVPAMALGAAYAVGAGLVGLAAAPKSTTPVLASQPIVDVADSDPGATWYFVLGRGVGFAVGLAAVLTAWAWVDDRRGSVSLALAPALVAVAVSTPGAAERIDAATGSDSILWRTLWAVPVAASLGLLLTVAPRCLPRWPRAAALVGPLMLVAAFAADGVWLGSTANRGAQLVWPPTWDVEPDSLAAAERLVELTPPGALAAAPVEVSGTLATITVDIRAVAPRDDSLKGSHTVPEMLADPRRSLSFSLTTGTLDPIAEELARTALTQLPVATACSRPGIAPDNGVLNELRAAGFVEVDRDEHCLYWTRQGPLPESAVYPTSGGEGREAEPATVSR